MKEHSPDVFRTGPRRGRSPVHQRAAPRRRVDKRCRRPTTKHRQARTDPLRWKPARPSIASPSPDRRWVCTRAWRATSNGQHTPSAVGLSQRSRLSRANAEVDRRTRAEFQLFDDEKAENGDLTRTSSTRDDGADEENRTPVFSLGSASRLIVLCLRVGCFAWSETIFETCGVVRCCAVSHPVLRSSSPS